MQLFTRKLLKLIPKIYITYVNIYIYIYMISQLWITNRFGSQRSRTDLRSQTSLNNAPTGTCMHVYIAHYHRSSRSSCVYINNLISLLNLHAIRYKIFVEGRSWSVSEKYTLACDSPNLFVTTHFYDFMTRSLMPGQHFWPINENSICRSIKFAVDWGNKNQGKVNHTS